MERTIENNNIQLEQLRKLLSEDRSRRRFNETIPLTDSILESLVGLTRYCASGRNLQPLRYRTVVRQEECRKVYPHLAWAGYLNDWDGPEEGERPTAYIVQCLDTRLTSTLLCDDGLQLQAITLGATALGLGGCIIKSFNASEIKNILQLPDYLEPRYIYALGVPKEEVEIVDTDGAEGADIKYYRKGGIHYVPKRPIEELLIGKETTCK